MQVSINFQLVSMTYTSGVDKLSVGTNQLSSQSNTLRDGITQLNKGIKRNFYSIEYDISTERRYNPVNY